MRIGVFSKFEMAGGSERRCVEMANALDRFTEHNAVLFAEGNFPASLEQLVRPGVKVVKHLLIGAGSVAAELYDLDCLLTVNTDSKFFCRGDYWSGKSGRHELVVDLARIPQLIFLFNFIVSPARHLWELGGAVDRTKIITANRKFLDEIGEQDRYRRVRHIPRIMLESPIDPTIISSEKRPSTVVRLGMHSTSNGDKWNSEWPRLIEEVNRRCGVERICWRLMGMPGSMRNALTRFPNVEAVAEHVRPVSEFLCELDLFVFFTSWKREEPWSRSAAEALMSGCPVLATQRGGNRDQIVSGNNGLLCNSLEHFAAAVTELVQGPRLRARMSENARLRAREYTSEAVIGKFMRFVDP